MKSISEYRGAFLFDIVYVLLAQLMNISKFALPKYGAVAEFPIAIGKAESKSEIF